MADPMAYIGKMVGILSNLHSVENPAGKVSLCVAENKLTHTALQGKLAECIAAGLPEECMGYTAGLGHHRLRTAFAGMMNATCVRRAIAPDRMAVTAGLTAAINLIACKLVPGGSVLVPRPYYPAFARDLGALAKASIVPVAAPSPRFVCSVEALDAALATAGPGPRMLLVTNPNNPTGTCFTAEELRGVAAWCASNDVELLVDEVYANCKLGVPQGAATPFVSVLDALEGPLGDRIHVMWGMSKDWAGSGLRVGFTYTENAGVLAHFDGLGGFCDVSHFMQHAIAGAFEDLPWCKAFLEDTQAKLTAAYHKVVAAVEATEGVVSVAAVPASALYVWLDFRRLLKDATPEGEAALVDDLLEAGVLMTPGLACDAGEPGFMRLCFASVPPDSLDVALDRIVAVCKA